MRIGIEEPLVANHQLYATSVAGTTELADFAVGLACIAIASRNLNRRILGT